MRGNSEYENRGVLYLIPPEPCDYQLRKIPLDQLFLGMLPGQLIERIEKNQDGNYILSKIEDISEMKRYHIKNADKTSSLSVKGRELIGRVHSFSKPTFYMVSIGNIPRKYDREVEKFEYFLEITPNCQCEFSIINNICSAPSEFIIKYYLEPKTFSLKSYGKTICKHAVYTLKKYFQKEFFYKRYNGRVLEVPFILLDEYFYDNKLIEKLVAQTRKDNPHNLTEFALSIRNVLEKRFNFEKFYETAFRLRKLNEKKYKLASQTFLL